MMTSIQTVFQRYESKYLLTDSQYIDLRNAIRDYTVPDIHGRSTVCSVYYDTPDSRLIRRSLEHPLYKEKLRLRSYGLAGTDTPVFLELKKKYDHIVYKRRLITTCAAASRYLNGDTTALPDSQIRREIDYFLHFYSCLEPAMFLAYERTAFTGKDEPLLRITFDDNIRCRETGLTLTDSLSGNPLLPAGTVLMELKVPCALPLWLTQLLSERHLYKTTFSKYGSAFSSQIERSISHA